MEKLYPEVVLTKESRRRERLEKLKDISFDVYYSLYRSTVRQELLLFLKNAGETMSVYDAATQTKRGYTNIKLAVFGDDRKYKKRYSLIATGLICCEEIDGVSQLSLTKKGADAAQILEASG